MKMQGWVKLQCMGFCVLMRVSLSLVFFSSLLCSSISCMLFVLSSLFVMLIFVVSGRPVL